MGLGRGQPGKRYVTTPLFRAEDREPTMAQSMCAARPRYVAHQLLGRLAASTAATYLALIITSAAVGYWAGVGSTLPISRGAVHDEPDNDSGEDSDGDDDDGLEKVTPGAFEECKLVRPPNSTSTSAVLQLTRGRRFSLFALTWA